jgi:glutathione synthase/RimK-type ligase-like ATP-grasp enzyme
MFGRAALALRAEGVEVLLGGRADGASLEGSVAVPGGWVGRTRRPDVLVHRFPDQSRPAAWAALAAVREGLPMVNPAPAVALCRDKLALQRALSGIPMPEVTGDDFAACLARWGTAFLKPRYGAFGEGVQRVTTLPEPLDGDWILQRAVAPPAGWAGWSCRVLVQREADGWVCAPGALRRHRDDPVVNRARGAEVVPAEDVLQPGVCAEMTRLAIVAAEQVARHRGCAHTGELGVDFALDPDHRPWLLEINGKPGGRLQALADADPVRFGPVLEAVAQRPLRWAASLATPGDAG